MRYFNHIHRSRSRSNSRLRSDSKSDNFADLTQSGLLAGSLNSRRKLSKSISQNSSFREPSQSARLIDSMRGKSRNRYSERNSTSIIDLARSHLSVYSKSSWASSSKNSWANTSISLSSTRENLLESDEEEGGNTSRRQWERLSRGFDAYLADQLEQLLVMSESISSPTGDLAASSSSRDSEFFFPDISQLPWESKEQLRVIITESIRKIKNMRESLQDSFLDSDE